MTGRHLLPLVTALLLGIGESPVRLPGHDTAEFSQAIDTTVVLETSMGDIRIRMLTDRAPLTVANFLQLVESGFYDEMLFHRVVRDFAVQAGVLGMEGDVRGLEVPPIHNEASRRTLNRRGSVAMARTDDPHSATTEFFINVRDNPELDAQIFPKRVWGFTVFGEVTNGMDVVDEISRLKTKKAGPFPNFPETPVAIYRARIETVP